MDDDLWKPFRGASVDPCDQALHGDCYVHTNMGVANKAFYLLAHGGTHNGATVAGIGLEAAFHIALEANRRHWGQLGKNFAGAAEGMARFARDEFGSTSPQLAQVAKAWHAVRVRSHHAADCNFDERVDGADIGRALQIAFVEHRLPECRTADRDGDRQVSVDEIVLAGIDGRQSGGRVAPTPAPASTPTPRRRAAATGPLMLEIWGVATDPGMSAVFPIRISGGGTQAGINLDLYYPSESITAPVCTLDPALATTHSIQSQVMAGGGRVRVIVYNLDGLPMRDGVLVVCSTEVSATASPRSFQIVAQRVTGSDRYGNRTYWNTTSGEFRILGPTDDCAIDRRPSPRASTVLLIALPILWRRMVRALRSRRGKWLGAVLLLGAVVLSADVASAQFHGRMRIKPRGGREVASDAMWFVADVVQDGQRVRGRVALVGAPEISVGRFEGRMRENGKVGGKIIDEDGRRWAVLRGSAVSDGITGTFQLRGGVPGDWEWVTESDDFDQRARAFAASRRRK